MPKIGHCLPKTFVGDNSTDTPQLIHSGVRLLDGRSCLGNGCSRLCIVHLYEKLAGLDLLPFAYVDSLDEAR
jgi:hypothetical protein